MRAAPVVAHGDHLALERVEGSEQGRRAVPLVVMGHGSAAALLHRQAGLGPDNHNENPKPFIWTAKAADIQEKVKRARAALNNRHSA